MRKIKLEPRFLVPDFDFVKSIELWVTADRPKTRGLWRRVCRKEYINETAWEFKPRLKREYNYCGLRDTEKKTVMF